MTAKKEFTFSVGQLLALIPVLVAAGTGFGWFSKPEERTTKESEIQAAIDSVNRENTVKVILDSLGRISSNVSNLTISVNTLKDTMNAISIVQLKILALESKKSFERFSMVEK